MALRNLSAGDRVSLDEGPDQFPVTGELIEVDHVTPMHIPTGPYTHVKRYGNAHIKTDNGAFYVVNGLYKKFMGTMIKAKPIKKIG